jgi:3-oxoadipate enol-lactonase
VTDLAWEAAGEGPPDLLLLHPGLGDRSFWDPAWARLARLGRAIRFDARAFGASPDPAGSFSPAEDAVAVLDAAGAERAVVVGVSYGSRAALDVAVGWPDRVAGLVLVSGPGEDDAALEARLAGVDAALEHGDFDAANAIEVDVWARDAAPEVREWVTAHNRALLERQAPLEDEPVFLEPPAAERLGEVHAPVLVLLGERDQPSTIAGARKVAEGADAEVVIVPGAGHLLGREEPEAFLAALEPFLRAASP